MESRIESKHYAAVDIGASSGRVLAGWVEDGKMSYQEVYRFDNEQKRVGGHDCWDVEALFDHVVAGLRAVRIRPDRLRLPSVSIPGALTSCCSTSTTRSSVIRSPTVMPALTASTKLPSKLWIRLRSMPAPAFSVSLSTRFLSATRP